MIVKGRTVKQAASRNEGRTSEWGTGNRTHSNRMREPIIEEYDPAFIEKIENAMKGPRIGPMSLEEAIRRKYV